MDRKEFLETMDKKMRRLNENQKKLANFRHVTESIEACNERYGSFEDFINVLSLQVRNNDGGSISVDVNRISLSDETVTKIVDLYHCVINDAEDYLVDRIVEDCDEMEKITKEL